MATTGTNNTVKWELSNNILTISPLSGGSGIAKGSEHGGISLTYFVSLTDAEWESVESLVFNGDVSFYYQDNIAITEPPTYSPIDDYQFFFPFSMMKNIASIDVTGLNTTGATSMRWMFSGSEPQITTLIGLNTLDTSQCENFSGMFVDLPLSSVDISSFNISQTANIDAMFNRMKYCQRITLPQNFSRKDSGSDYERSKYFLGITSSGTIPITKDGVTITNDEDFFKLTSTTQGGTWERDLSGVATLSFKVTSSIREGDEATVSFNYLTTSATARVYLKKSTDSSFPSSPVQTINLNGTGSSSTVLQLATDDAYDVMIIVDDGETTLYTYPSIDSNVLLLSVDEEGNTEQPGRATTKDLTSAQIDAIIQELGLHGRTICPYDVGDIYITRNATNPANKWDGTTWRQIKDTFLLAAGDTYSAGSTGGSATVKLTDPQMAHGHGFTNPTVDNHQHPLQNWAVGTANLTMTGKRAYSAASPQSLSYVVSTSTTSLPNVQRTNDASAGTSGGSVANLSGASSTRTAHENMPPYLTVYAWERLT